jgi:branched-chain amino acid transport system substrate-binding protein
VTTGSVPKSRRRQWLLSIGIVGVVSVVLAACGSSSSSSTTSSTNSAASEAALGAPNPAKGSPVPVGLISDAGPGVSDTGNLVESGAKMATEWANEYEGGIGGHPINLIICENQGTPAGGQVCANQMVQQHVVAVTLPFTGQGPTEVPTIVGAGIPYVALSGESEQELTSPGAFDLTGGFPADLGAIALSAKAKGYKKVALLTENVPTAIEGADELGAIVFKSAGVGYVVIPVQPGTADMSPQLESAITGGASALTIVGDITDCTSFLQAYQTLSLTQPKYLIGPCIAPSVIQSLGSVLKGSYVPSTSATSATDAEVYAAMTRKFAPSINPDATVSSNQASGAEAVWALVNAMKGITGPVTAASVLQQLRTAKNVPLPLSGGLTFTCDGTAIPLLKNICSSVTYIGTLTATGTVQNLVKYDTSPLFKS